MRRALGLWALVLAALGGVLAPPARAASDAGRELRLELALIAANARAAADATTQQPRREALGERVRSSLGSLMIAARYAIQAHAVPQPAPVPHSERALLAAIGELRAAFADCGPTPASWIAFTRAATDLAAAYPIDLSYFTPLAMTAGRVQAGRAIYQRYCSGCHASPDSAATNPAPNLFELARSAPRDELLVRLLGGIHGDRTTSLENPFSDEEIAALAAYFLSVEPANASAISRTSNGGGSAKIIVPR